MAAKKEVRKKKTTPAQARKMLGGVRLAVDKKHLRVHQGHRVMVEMDGNIFHGHVTKTTGDGRVQFHLETPISKDARTLDDIVREAQQIRKDFGQFHGRLETGNASVYLLAEAPKAPKQRKRVLKTNS